MPVQASLTPEGKLSFAVPEPIRQRLGLSDGMMLDIVETEDGLLLRAPHEGLARAQAIVRRYTGHLPDSGSEAFIANRRAEWGE